MRRKIDEIICDCCEGLIIDRLNTEQQIKNNVTSYELVIKKVKSLSDKDFEINTSCLDFCSLECILRWIKEKLFD